jgi:UTP:GlnB (protein PII) uridylyltransferase
VSPQPEPDHWKVDVACRDASGLLARLTDVLREEGFDVASADIATWPDGAVLDSFVVRSSRRPSPRELAHAMETRLRRPLRTTPMRELTVEFDNEALPWHTSCTVTGPDQPGVLQAVSAAFAATKLIVHSARVGSANARVNDRFTLTDRLGRKLDTEAMDRVRAALAGEKVRARSRHIRTEV